MSFFELLEHFRLFHNMIDKGILYSNVLSRAIRSIKFWTCDVTNMLCDVMFEMFLALIKPRLTVTLISYLNRVFIFVNTAGQFQAFSWKFDFCSKVSFE